MSGNTQVRMRKAISTSSKPFSLHQSFSSAFFLSLSLLHSPSCFLSLFSLLISFYDIISPIRCCSSMECNNSRNQQTMESILGEKSHINFPPPPSKNASLYFPRWLSIKSFIVKRRNSASTTT